MTVKPLTEDQEKILHALRVNRECPLYTRDVSECCDHWYDTAWAKSRLETLLRRGLVEKLPNGMWKIKE